MILTGTETNFPTLASGIHLLSHSLGPVPRAARESMLGLYRRLGTSHQRRRMGHELVGALATRRRSHRAYSRRRARLGSDPAKRIDCARHRRLVFRFQQRRRNKVVTTALDFPSMEYFWDAQRQIGARVEVVPSDDAISVPLERILDAIDNETCSRRARAHVVLQLISRRCACHRRTRACKRRARAAGRLPVSRRGRLERC